MYKREKTGREGVQKGNWRGGGGVPAQGDNARHEDEEGRFPLLFDFYVHTDLTF